MNEIIGKIWTTRSINRLQLLQTTILLPFNLALSKAFNHWEHQATIPTGALFFLLFRFAFASYTYQYLFLLLICKL